MAKRVLHDRYFRQAKREGYVARSAYKLLEINDRRPVIKRNDRVLDMGCAPGSWLQAASNIVGDHGVVVGIDLKRVERTAEAGFGPNVHHMTGDIRKVPAEDLLAPIRDESWPNRLFDTVISDMAPDTTGHGDDLRSTHLCRDVLARCPELLKPRGDLVMKVLEGGEFADLLNECKAFFNRVGAIKPKASRDVSRETFVIAQAFWPTGRPDRRTQP